MNNISIPHVLVVDDDARLRKLLARYLTEHGWVVTVAQNADDARIKLQFFKYDAMVLDVMMPRETGIEFLQSSNSVLPATLMLTAMGEVDERIAGLEAGAEDYLAKPFEPKELLLRLQKIIARNKVTSKTLIENMVKFGDFQLDLSGRRLSKLGEQIHLTEAEMSLLILLARNLNNPLSRDEILQSIGVANDENNSRTADVLITRLRKKIEPDPARPLHLQTMRGEGYVLRS